MARIDIELDRSGSTPIYRQIYDRVRQAILSGRLPPGARLPSARSLASQLATARGTVETAYALLAGEGYVVARGAAGTIVEPGLRQAGPRPAGGAATAPGTASGSTPGAAAIDGLSLAAAPPQRPFQVGVPALDAFPRKLWARTSARRARHLPDAALGYQDAAGEPALRLAVASYLALSRGIACDPAEVFITAGFQGALGLAAHVLLPSGAAAWVEDPGYFLARRGLVEGGARLVPVPVDAEGLDVEAGIARAAEARLALVTPTHQMPLGVTLTLRRRLALLDWARAAGAWIVEDDYDSEFHYRGRPLPALKSLDTAGRVLYAGSFSKVLFPGLRLGYLVVPASQADRFAHAAASLHPAPAGPLPSIVAEFLTEGHFARHIRRMRGLYARRRQALADALAAEAGGLLRLAPRDGGMHLLAWLEREENDVEAMNRAHRAGLAPMALTPFAVSAPCPPGLLLGFPNVAEPMATALARRLARALADR